MKALYEAYHDKAVILVVYIREAHPASSKQTAEDAGWKAIGKTVFYQPKTYAERRKLAETACTFWELPIPTLVDTMDPSINSLYDAHPNRTYLIDTEGKIVYRGVKGPRGVNVHEAELELRKLLGITEGKPVTKPSGRSRTPSGRGRLGGRRSPPQGGADDSEDKPQGEADDSEDKPQGGADDSEDKPQGGADDSEDEPQKPER